MEQPEAAPDLVGRTSARLLAAGVERRERLDALRLLAILDASVDATGRIRRPVDDLAGEFDLPALSVLRSLDHLERAGAVRRDGGHAVLLGSNPDGFGGMQLADFLDDVRASFDGDAAPTPHRSTWLARSGAALVAAAAAVAVFSLAPSQTAIERPVSLAGSTTTTADTTTTLAGDATTTTAGGRVAPASEVPATIEAPVGAATETTVLAAQVPCPTGSPVADVVDGLVQITNPSEEDVVVTSMSLGAATLDQHIEVPAGETITHTIPATIAPLDAEIVSWEWARDPVARSCPS